MRKRFFQLLTLIIISFTIFTAISQQRKEHIKEELPDSSNLIVEVPEGLDEKTFSMQAKLILSLIRLVESQSSIDEHDKQQTKQALVASVSSYFETSPIKVKNPYLRAKELIFAKYLALKVDKLCEVKEDAESEIEIFNQSLCNSTVLPTLPDYDQNRLSWFFKLQQNPTGEIFSKDNLVKFTFGIGIIVIVLIGSAALCLMLALYWIFAKPKPQFSSQGMNADYSLEIFCLYLLGMNLMPYIISKLNLLEVLKVNGLSLNIIAISSLSILLVWPLLFGVKIKDIRDRIGLNFYSLSRIIKDLFVGIGSYWTATLPLLFLLSIYSLILVRFGVNVEQGAHPIVPIVASSKDSKTIWLIIILAVVVAPIIEEIMFRGAFYSWLRSRFSAVTSILVSAIIFAAIHPQGAIGILPLGFIGVVLATIREMRGNIIACMFTHACFNGGTLLLVLSAFR